MILIFSNPCLQNSLAMLSSIEQHVKAQQALNLTSSLFDLISGIIKEITP